jgi:hypothetical protein
LAASLAVRIASEEAENNCLKAVVILSDWSLSLITKSVLPKDGACNRCVKELKSPLSGVGPLPTRDSDLTSFELEWH